MLPFIIFVDSAAKFQHSFRVKFMAREHSDCFKDVNER